MEYPKWLEEEIAWAEDYESVFGDRSIKRIIEMAKDAWAMAYLAGTGMEMSLGDFISNYQDAPKNEIPSVSFDHPNDGGGV